MDFIELQQTYKDLTKEYFGGRLSVADFHREMRGQVVLDGQDRRWRINSHTGKWQRLQDGLWITADPNTVPSQSEQSLAGGRPVYDETRPGPEIILGLLAVVLILVATGVIAYFSVRAF